MIRQHTPDTSGDHPRNKTLLRYLAASQGNPVSTTLEHKLTDAELSEPIEFDPLEPLEVLSMQGQLLLSGLLLNPWCSLATALSVMTSLDGASRSPNLIMSGC